MDGTFQMLLSLVRYGLLLWLSYVVWNALRRFWRGSILDTIPGPPSESFLAGKFGFMSFHHVSFAISVISQGISLDSMGLIAGTSTRRWRRISMEW